MAIEASVISSFHQLTSCDIDYSTYEWLFYIPGGDCFVELEAVDETKPQIILMD